MKTTDHNNTALFLILGAGLTFRLLLTSFGTFHIDFGDWLAWSNRLVTYPFSQFYDAWSDYLPGYLYILWLLGIIRNFFSSGSVNIPLELLYKFPAIVADLSLALISFNICRKFLNQKYAYVISFIFLFNPAIFVNSTLWGQIDSLNTFFYVATFLLLIRKSVLLSSVCMAIALLLKPQGVFMLPLAFALALKERWQLMDFLKGFISFSLIFFGAFIPFLNKFNIFKFVFERYTFGLNQYQYTSVNAFNFWEMTKGSWKPDSQIWSGLSLQNWGMIIFIIVYILVLWRFWKNYGTKEKENVFLTQFSLSVMFLCSFIFLTRVHERLLLTPLIFLMLAAIFKRELWIFVVILSVTYIANLYFSFMWVTQNFRYVFSTGMINIISSLNLLVFVVLLIKFLGWKGSFNEKEVI